MARMLILLLLGSLLIATGCGGDDDSDGNADASEREWAAEVNSICRENRDRVGELVNEVRAEGLTRNEAAAEVLERSQGTQEELLDRMAAVDTPEDLRGDFDRFINQIRDSLPLFERLADAVRAGKNDPELNTELLEVAARTRPFATEHDLNNCLADAPQ
jgi:LPS sulfotransferase NodH